MKRLSVATHIALAMAMITASLVMLAHSIGLIPDPRAAHLKAREAITDLIARCVADAAGERKFDRVEALARDLAARNRDIVSVGVRMSDGTLVVTTPRHAEEWEAKNESTSPYARVPIMSDGRSFADVEIRFRDLSPPGWQGWVAHPMAALVMFCGGIGFAAYRLYLRRVLSYLDPTAAIPERVRMVLDSLVEGVILLDTKERIVLINRAFEKMTGQRLEDVIGKPVSSFSWIDRLTSEPPMPAPWIETIEDGALRAGLRLALRFEGGRTIQLSAACAPIAAADGRRRGVVITLADQTESESQRSEMEDLFRTLAASQREIAKKNQELTLLATTDPLTECLNRRAWFERAEQCWLMAKRSGRPLSCVMVDVDHFKSVNDRFGHNIGDNVLKRVGALLRDAAREQDVVGRYGGEEFCLVLPDTDAAGARVLAESVRQLIEAETIEGVKITASLGVSDSGMKPPALKDILAEADQALYAAKRAGRNRVELFAKGRRRDAA